MTIEKAMQRIVWRVSNGTHTPNQNDVEAVKIVAEWINRQKEQEIQQNRLFAKMYVYNFIWELEFYKDIKYAQRKMHEICKTPLTKLYDDFKNKFNSIEYNSLLKCLNFCTLPEITITKEQKQKNAVLTIENSEVIKEHIKGIYTTETIRKGLNNQISEAINHYKNLN